MTLAGALVGFYLAMAGSAAVFDLQILDIHVMGILASQ